jgi:hypothetical protein
VSQQGRERGGKELLGLQKEQMGLQADLIGMKALST